MQIKGANSLILVRKDFKYQLHSLNYSVKANFKDLSKEQDSISCFSSLHFTHLSRIDKVYMTAEENELEVEVAKGEFKFGRVVDVSEEETGLVGGRYSGLQDVVERVVEESEKVKSVSKYRVESELM